MKKLNSKNKIGFTLIELLAAVVILALIALITVPLIGNYIESSRRKGFISSVYHAIDSIENDLATDDFKDFPLNGIHAQDELVSIERNPFIGGKFMLRDKKVHARMVTDGRYCALGNKEELDVILGECYLLDKTPPVIESFLAGHVTSNSIQVIVKATDWETDIVSYEYSKDNGKTFTEKTLSDTYTFTNLKHDTQFNMVVRVTNENKLSSTKGITLKTLLIHTPTYSSEPSLGSWSQSKNVTITYPGVKQSNFIYEYRKDSGAWQVVNATSQDVLFNANGTLEARVRDGYNTVSASTLTITTIDTGSPSVPTSVVRYERADGTVRGNSSNWSNRVLWWGNFNSTDTGDSGIARYEYSQNCTGSVTGTLSSSYTYATGTNYQFCIRAVDKASNTSGWSNPYYFKVDTVKPTCGVIYVDGTMGNNGWYRTNISVSKTDGSDDFSGHETTTISTGYIDSEGETTIRLTTKDKAGNSCTTSKKVSMDKTAPTCSVTGGSTTWSNQDRTITGTPEDCGPSGCGGSVNASISWTAYKGSPGTVYDNAGNSVACGETDVNVDKTPPAVPTIETRAATSANSTWDQTTAFNNRYIYCGGANRYHFGHMKFTSSDDHSGVNYIRKVYWYGPNAASGCGYQSEGEGETRYSTVSNGHIDSIICNSGGLAYTKAFACDNAGNCSVKSSLKSLTWNTSSISSYINGSNC